MNPRRLHTVSVTLPGARDDLTEVLTVLASRLPRSRTTQAVDSDRRPVLRITVATTDIWLAVLVVMNAVTSTGYEPVQLDVGPASELEAEEYDQGSTPGSAGR